jgi:hypothetical protein
MQSLGIFVKEIQEGMPDRASKVFINKYYNNGYSINSEKDGSPNL